MARLTSRVIIKSIIRESHPDLDNFKRGLFSVNPEANQELMGHIGDWVMFRTTTNRGLISLLPHKIVHLQKDYKGQVVFRVENQANKFGTVLDPKNARFISVDQARKIWNDNYSLVYGRETVPFDPDFNFS